MIITQAKHRRKNSLFEGKRGVALTLNVLVIAVLVLAVMVVLIIIFSGRIGSFTRNVESCVGKGGVCEPADIDGGCKDSLAPPLLGTDCSAGQVCCLRLIKATDDQK